MLFGVLNLPPANTPSLTHSY